MDFSLDAGTEDVADRIEIRSRGEVYVRHNNRRELCDHHTKIGIRCWYRTVFDQAG
jgi:hypothetical protein